MFDDTDDGTPRHRRNGLSRPFSRAQIAAWIALAVSVLQYALFVAPILPVSAILPVTLVFVLAVAAVVYAGAQTVLIDPVDVHLCRHWRTTTAIATAAAAALSNNNSNSNDDHEEDHNNNNNNNEHHQNQHSRNNNNHNSGAVAVVEISYNALRNPMHRPPALYKNATATTKTTLFDALYLRANAMRQAQPLPATEAMKHCWICDVTVADHSMHCKFCNKCVYHYDHHCMCTYRYIRVCLFGCLVVCSP